MTNFCNGRCACVSGFNGLFSGQPGGTATFDLQVYNPVEQLLFPATSTLVVGPSEAILFDAQFQKMMRKD
ncbi:hypothetical protein ACU6U9_04375 [Pseudomonas sp. HK3]|jgi:hypothetical protein